MSDLISRQAAIDALDEIEAEVADGYGYQYAKWREYFVEMPSAQPERKTGKWIDAVVADTLQVIVCDQCNTFFPLAFGDSHNFCPNCGADMREVTT